MSGESLVEGVETPSCNPGDVVKTSDFSGTTPGGGKKKLIYVALKNTVICKDVSNTSAVVEVWRKIIDKTSFYDDSRISIVHCGGVVVAHFHSALVALDALTGEERWRYQMGCDGYGHYVTLVAMPLAICVGYAGYVDAVSSSNGTLAWRYQFEKPSTVPLPAILVCGERTVLAEGNEIACVNTADGKVIWKVNQAFNSPFPHSAAWNGKDHVLLSSDSCVCVFSLSDGTPLKKINFECSSRHVLLAYDDKLNVFFAYCGGVLYGISGDDYHSLWTRSFNLKYFPLPYGHYCMGVDSHRHRVFVVQSIQMHCVDASGNVVFSKEYISDFSLFAPTPSFCSICMDLEGTGLIYLGYAGRMSAFDHDGNAIIFDGLRGLGYSLPSICTQTVNTDPNSSGDAINFAVSRARRDADIISF